MIHCNHNTIHDMLCTKLYYILITRFYNASCQQHVHVHVIREAHKEHALISYNGADATSSILEVHEDPPLAYRRSMQLLLLPSRSSMQLIPLLSRRSIHPSFFPLGRSRSWTIAWNKRLSYKAWVVQHDKSHLKVMQQAQPSRHVVIVAITQSGRYFSLTLII